MYVYFEWVGILESKMCFEIFPMPMGTTCSVIKFTQRLPSCRAKGRRRRRRVVKRKKQCCQSKHHQVFNNFFYYYIYSLLKVFFFIFTHRRHWVGSERLPAPQIAVCSALLFMDDGDFSRKNERVWCDKKKSRYYIDYSAYRLFVVWQQSVGKNKLVCFNTSLSCIQTYF